MIYNQKWMRKYELLKAYQKEYGNIDVPTDYEKDGIKLGIWLASQKQAYRGHGSSVLTEERIKLLEDLGMNWEKREKKWNQYYELLTEYKKEHGNIDVPYFYEKNGVKLGIWLTNQKQAYKGQVPWKITENQIKLLNDLEIDWSQNDTKFLNRKIKSTTTTTYQQILLERINHIMDDLVYEKINDIDATNQKEIEKILIKRIWR